MKNNTNQEMSALKAFAYKNLGRHLMNRNVKKIRNKKTVKRGVPK